MAVEYSKIVNFIIRPVRNTDFEFPQEVVLLFHTDVPPNLLSVQQEALEYFSLLISPQVWDKIQTPVVLLL